MVRNRHFVRNWDGKVDLHELRALAASAERRGIQIDIGHEHGAIGLSQLSVNVAQGKSWKWREPGINPGTAIPAHWIPIREFVRIAEQHGWI